VRCEVYFTPHNQPLKMEQIKCSETSAFNNQTSGKYPKDYTQYSKHDESLKSRNPDFFQFLYSPWNCREFLGIWRLLTLGYMGTVGVGVCWVSVLSMSMLCMMTMETSIPCVIQYKIPGTWN